MYPQIVWVLDENLFLMIASMLCISISEWVLRTPFAHLNQFFTSIKEQNKEKVKKFVVDTFKQCWQPTFTCILCYFLHFLKIL